MSKFFKYLCATACVLTFSSLTTSCNLDDSTDADISVEEWKKANDNWIVEQEQLTDEDGNKVYTRVVPAWDKNAYVLMRWFNDTTLTRNNIRPLYTSTVDCKYIGRLYDDEPFDSSYNNITPADSIFRSKLTNVIGGWTIAFERMHAGDSVEVIVPYSQGYGSTATSAIPAYSMLKFNIKFVDVVAEYIRE